MTIGISETIALISCGGVGTLISYLFNRRKNKGELESIIYANYELIITRLGKEVDRNSEKLLQMEAREKLFIENTNLLMKDKMELSGRVLKLEESNKILHSENMSLKKSIDQLMVELNKERGIRERA